MLKTMIPGLKMGLNFRQLLPYLAICYLIIGAVAAHATANNLFQNLTSKYDKKMRPNGNGKAVNVEVQIGILALGPFDQQTFEFDVELYLRHWWNDPRLQFEGNSSYNYNGNPADVFWVPDTYIENSQITRTHALITENKRARVMPNGDVYFSMRASATCSCPMNLKLYPMDTQDCSILLESYAFSGRNLKLLWKDKPVTIDAISDKLHIPSYNLDEIQTKTITHSSGSKTEFFSVLQCVFKIKRSFKFYLNRIYLPSSFLVILSWATFYIPPSSIPARITLIITNFLATIFVMQGAASQVARVAYSTAMDVYMVANVVFISCALVELLIVLNVPNPEKAAGNNKDEDTMAHEDDENASDNATNQLSPSMGLKCCSKKTSHRNRFSAEETHFADKYARIIFPISYFGFVSVYFGYYAIVAGI